VIIGKFHAFVNRAFWRNLMVFGVLLLDCHVRAMFCNEGASDPDTSCYRISVLNNGIAGRTYGRCKWWIFRMEKVNFSRSAMVLLMESIAA